MSTNMTREDTDRMSVVVTHPAVPVSGDPVRVGLRTGVALTNEGAQGNDSTKTSVDFGAREWRLSVRGVDDGGNSAVAVNDALFYTDGDTPPLSKKASGYFFGYAQEAVSSGATTTIKVIHEPSPGSGTLASGAVGTTQLAASGVTAPKLSSTLRTGYIPIPLTAVREVVTNDIPNTAGDAGVLSSNTSPALARVNGATDPKLRLVWVATNVDPITFDFAYPADLDDASDLTINVVAAMAGATDTPTLAVGYYEGVGDTNAGGNTAAITGTTPALYSRTITAANIAASPIGASIVLTPAAHGTDALYIYSAWVAYTRK